MLSGATTFLMIRFFTPEEEKAIIQRIAEAERQTSGEVRVHLAEQIERDVLQDARMVFQRLGMAKTAARNGVLIYVVPKAHRFAIVGDEGIDEVVPEGFWDEVRDSMQAHFRRKAFALGVMEGISKVAEKLATFFPHQGEHDENELPDDISYD